jgi:hypothetical protein
MRVLEIIKHLPKNFATECGFQHQTKMGKNLPSHSVNFTIMGGKEKMSCPVWYADGCFHSTNSVELCNEYGSIVNSTCAKGEWRDTDYIQNTSHNIFDSFKSKSKLPATSTLKATLDLEGHYSWLKEVWLGPELP